MSFDLPSMLAGWMACCVLFLFCDFCLSPLLYVVFGLKAGE